MDTPAKAGWPISPAALQASLASIKLPDAASAQLLEQARPAVMLATRAAADQTIDVGASKIGGMPDVPPDFVWPLRPAYPDADEAAQQLLEHTAIIMATAGVTPPWLPPAQAEKLIVKSRRDHDKQNQALAKLAEEGRREWQRFEASKKYSDEDKALYRSMLQGSVEDFAPIPAPTAEEAATAHRNAVESIEMMRSEFPLAFLAQIDLAALPGLVADNEGWPRSGRLYFFYDLLGDPPGFDPASRPSFRVIHDDSPRDTLARHAPPPPLARMQDTDQAIVPSAAVAASPVTTSAPIELLKSRAIKLSPAQTTRYDEWLLDQVGWPGEPDSQRHQIGGWPRAVQATMFSTAQMASHGIDAGEVDLSRGKRAKEIWTEAGKWHLLFQFGPDPAAAEDMPGAINFLLHEDDLKAGRFDRAWAIYEQD